MTRRSPESPLPLLRSIDRLRLPLAAGSLALAGLLAGCATTSEEVTVDSLIAWADYQGAIDLASKRVERDPDDAAAQRDLDRAHVAALLDISRDANFRGDYEVSLEALAQAESIMPGQPDVEAWRTKSTQQLAASLRETGRAFEAAGDFESAFADFQRADELDPDGPLARTGAERVLLRANHRQGLGDAYYRKGVRALREYRTAESVQNLDASLKYQPDDPRHMDRRAEAAELLAEERLRIAQELESQGIYRAARNEYRLALLIVEGLAEAEAGLERTTAEVQVLDFLDEAQRALILDDFDRALVRVERAGAITQQQSEAVSIARDEVIEARLQWMYDYARELEGDYAFLPAIDAYEKLLVEADGFYDDAIARRDTLVSYIELAEDFYTRANQATTEAEQLDYLRRINLIWPSYRDVANRLAALESR